MEKMVESDILVAVGPVNAPQIDIDALPTWRQATPLRCSPTVADRSAMPAPEQLESG